MSSSWKNSALGMGSEHSAEGSERVGSLSSSEMLRMSLCVTVGIHKSPIHAVGIIKFKEPFMQGTSLALRKR